ncbi:MAG: O-antigen translocase [bacterium]
MIKYLIKFLMWLKKFFKTELFTALSTTSLTTGIQMVTGLAINKIVAVTIGPSGIALVGQFDSFKTLITNFASGSFGNGLTKYVADPDYSTRKVISTSNIFSGAVSVVLGLLTILFAKQLSEYLLKDSEYFPVFIVFGFLLPLFSLNKLLLSTINGFRKFKLLAYLKITNSVVGLILSIALVLSFNLTGALFAHAINTSIVFLVSLFILYYFFSIGQLLSFNVKQFDKKLLLKLLAFTLMALTSAQLKPLVKLFIRSYIIENASQTDAGIWQGMMHLSTKYLAVITSALGVYYLPKLSSLKTKIELRREIFRGIKVIMPAFSVMAIVIFLIKEWVVIILYSHDFLEMTSLFFPKLIADFFLIFSFLIAYLMLAKAMVKLFMISQIIFAGIRVGLSVILFDQLGIIGVIWGDAIRYFLYSIFLVIAFRKTLLTK